MAASQGRLGLVTLGLLAGVPDTVIEVTNFDYTSDAEELEVSAYQQTAKRYLAGLEEAGGSFAMNWDDLDATGQEAITVGAELTLTYYPRGNVNTPLGYLTSEGNDAGTDTVTFLGEDVAGPVDGIVTRVYRFRGELIRATLP